VQDHIFYETRGAAKFIKHNIHTDPCVGLSWGHGVEVTHCVRSTKLLYAGSV